jgi:hypothetical protein
VSVFSQSPIDVDEDYLVRPQLYNPLREPDRYQNSLIPISEPLVGGYRGLYVSSSYAERMMLPGVPTLICATLLAYYVKREYAWKFATDLKSDDRIVKVDFVGAADEATCERAEQILKGALSAEIVNSR